MQQNFRFIKNGNPDNVLILSGDHIYEMNYDAMVAFHGDQGADLTIASIRVPVSEASRYGILDVGDDFRVNSFVEKPQQPPSNLANMGVYIFNFQVLNDILWEDRERLGTSHDFGKDIIPRMIASGDAGVRLPLFRLLGRCGHHPLLLAVAHGPAGHATADQPERPLLDHPYPDGGAPTGVARQEFNRAG